MTVVMVTGSDGHLARHVIPALERAGHKVAPFDRPLDVRSVVELRETASWADAEWCIHLAGLKYADRAELDPVPTVDVNVQGTANVVKVFGERCVVASTCKAADPETVYGASKLIAERIALEAGSRVVRLVNVLGSPGSVVDIWADVPADEPLPVCDATRLFIGAERAARLFVDALGWPSGRYAPDDPREAHMLSVAAMLYGPRATRHIPLRRGDRRHERLLAECERAKEWAPFVVRITGPHDPAPVEAPAAEAVAQP